MLSKLPKWVLVGGWGLAFVAGMTNAVAILGFTHQPVSHMTASTSHLAVAAADADWHELAAMSGVIGSFFLGAVFCGWMIRSTVLQLGRRYGTAMLIESLALASAALLLQHGSVVGIGLCCFACGLQNGLAATFSGAIVRTTHMTGLFTDLGVHIGQLLRGQPADLKRLRLYSSLITGFACGGAAAALAIPHLGNLTLLVPAAIVAASSFGYRVLRLEHHVPIETAAGP